MIQQSATAQLVTSFEPGISPTVETTVARALAQWGALDAASQAEALLIVKDGDRRRVYGRAAIAQLTVAR